MHGMLLLPLGVGRSLVIPCGQQLEVALDSCFGAGVSVI